MVIDSRREGLDGRGAPAAPTIEQRALAMWPRLDRAALRHCNHDPVRIASLVARRTGLPNESIVGMLVARTVTEDEAATWFG